MKGIDTEDWRYVVKAETVGHDTTLYWLMSLVFPHLTPTLLVWFAFWVRADGMVPIAGGVDRSAATARRSGRHRGVGLRRIDPVDPGGRPTSSSKAFVERRADGTPTSTRRPRPNA